MPKRLAAYALRGLRLIAIAYLIIVLGMSFLERWLVYPAPQPGWGDWNPSGGDYTEAWIEVPAAGKSKHPTRVHGWFFDQPAPEHVVLYCHGNGEDVSNQPQLARLLRDRLNAAVLVFDYRGYGKSEGVPTEAGVVADGLAAQRWLAEQTGRNPDGVVVFGRSLGGGVATAIAAEQDAAALILQSTFARLPDTAASHFPWLPVRWVMQNRYDSLARLAAYTGPVLVSHGTEDRVVPFEQGRQLFEAAIGPKRFIEFDGLGHNTPQPPSYYDDLERFLAEKR